MSLLKNLENRRVKIFVVTFASFASDQVWVDVFLDNANEVLCLPCDALRFRTVLGQAGAKQHDVA
jgi:hypothetical protein